MKPTFRIALLIETSSTYGREILTGVQRFIQENDQQHWIAVIEERDLNSGTPAWIQDWAGDGIISRHASDDIHSAVLDMGVALVDLNDRRESNLFTRVLSDDVGIGRIAAEHLHERGFENLAFCGFSNEAWSERRAVGFHEFANSVGANIASSHCADWLPKNVEHRMASDAAMIQWLNELPKPVGVMACNDACGKRIIDGCHQAGISVPETVAVIGVDNDELLCNFSYTPLSSVIPNAEAVGHKAASELAALMAGSESEASNQSVDGKKCFQIQPLGIAVRKSSDIVTVGDEGLAAAMVFIHKHACAGITVTEVVNHCGVSRSTLERKMRAFLNRTPQQEIQRVRMRAAGRLLTGGSESIETIALKCGYDNPEYFHTVFKREWAVTPGEFRDQGTEKRVQG